MDVRNCSELGENAIRIVKRLMSNQDLVKLLYYTDKDPLSHENLTEEQINKEVYQKLIKIIPRVGPVEYSNSIIGILIVQGSSNENNEFEDIEIQIEIFVPITQWFIKDTNLRPFKIMGEIQKSLHNKTINGLGKMKGGDFMFNYVSEEMTCYKQFFSITTYD